MPPSLWPSCCKNRSGILLCVFHSAAAVTVCCNAVVWNAQSHPLRVPNFAWNEFI